jgi:hypothetical protein
VEQDDWGGLNGHHIIHSRTLEFVYGFSLSQVALLFYYHTSIHLHLHIDFELVTYYITIHTHMKLELEYESQELLGVSLFGTSLFGVSLITVTPTGRGSGFVQLPTRRAHLPPTPPRTALSLRPPRVYQCPPPALPHTCRVQRFHCLPKVQTLKRTLYSDFL